MSVYVWKKVNKNLLHCHLWFIYQQQQQKEINLLDIFVGYTWGIEDITWFINGNVYLKSMSKINLIISDQNALKQSIFVFVFVLIALGKRTS